MIGVGGSFNATALFIVQCGKDENGKSRSKDIPVGDERKVLMGKVKSGMNKVGASLGVTLNTGNFTSLRVDTSMELACEDVEEGHAFLVKDLPERLIRFIEGLDLKEYLPGFEFGRGGEKVDAGRETKSKKGMGGSGKAGES